MIPAPSRWQRLQLAVLHLRHSWRFRWAHKPLCDRFQHDVLRFGSFHVCRSCSCVYLGMLLGGIALALLLPHAEVLLVTVLAVLAVTLGMSLPTWYHRWPRRLRDLLRAGLGVSIVAPLLLACAGWWVLAAVYLLALVTARTVYSRIRASYKSRICAGCPQLGQDGVCDGYSQQSRALRAYEEEATELLYKKGLPCH